MTTSFFTTLQKTQCLLKARLSKLLRCKRELPLINLPQAWQVEMKIKVLLPNYRLLPLKIPRILTLFTPYCSAVPAISSSLEMALLEGFCCYLLSCPIPPCVQRRKSESTRLLSYIVPRQRSQMVSWGRVLLIVFVPGYFLRFFLVFSLKVQTSLLNQQQYRNQCLQTLEAVSHSLLSSSFWLYWNQIVQG